MYKIEAVTVCCHYSDFLAETAKYNRGLFDKWLVITTPQDYATREVCRKFNLQCILSEDGHRFENEFAKGRMVERALQHLSDDAWRCHIDADIVLPSDFGHRLMAADLQEDTIHGIDRIMIYSYEEWQKLLASGYIHGGQFDYHCRMNIPMGAVLGTRWTHPTQGYVPIGFFQLWHSSQDEWRGVRVKPYPTNHGNACRTDVQHALQWDRRKRALIPEIIGVHLESEKTPKGTNWNGRRTKQFGPKLLMNANAKLS